MCAQLGREGVELLPFRAWAVWHGNTCFELGHGKGLRRKRRGSHNGVADVRWWAFVICGVFQRGWARGVTVHGEREGETGREHNLAPVPHPRGSRRLRSPGASR